MTTLSAQKREPNKRLSILRNSNQLPAVFYGVGQKSTPITVNFADFQKAWKKAGESSTITLKTETEPIETLIHDVQFDPVKGNPIHVDFLAIDVNKKISVKVPIEFIGVSEAVRSGLGALVKVLHELEIEALPKDLPHNLFVDISKLQTLEDQIFVSDIVLPKGVEAVTKLTEVVTTVSAFKEEKEEVEPVDLSKIEVEKKGKKEDEGIEGEATTIATPPASDKKQEKKNEK